MSQNNIKPLCRSVSIALAILSLSNQALSAEFSTTPFSLQNQTITTGQSRIKPNVMLLIDDSGSMEYAPGDSVNKPRDVTKSKMYIAKSALNAVLDEHKDKINWGLQTLNNNNNVNLGDYTDNWQAIKNRVDRMQPNNGTPTTPRYYEVSKDVRNKTRYRCQKNFIVVMSDGDANNSQIADTWMVSGTEPFTYNGRTQRVYSYQPARIRPYFPLNTVNDPGYFGVQRGGRAVADSWPIMGTDGRIGYLMDVHDTFWDRNTGLQWFSSTLATKDFKVGGVDAAGKSWDGDPSDPKDANGNSRYKDQLVQTFTISFGDGVSAEGKKYLQNGASNPSFYFNASEANSLKEAFSKIFENIDNASQNLGGESGSAIAPALAGETAPTSAITVRLNSDTWSSQIRFYDVVNGQIGSSYKLPSFANRRTLINIGTGTYFYEDLSATATPAVNNAFFGITAPVDAADQNEWAQALRPWTMRSANPNDAAIKQLAAARKYSQAYRERAEGTRDLGDIVDSPVTAIGEKTGGRQRYLVTAANDGMVHLFQSLNGTANPYDLKVSYIPATMERANGDSAATLASALKDVAREGYGKTGAHRYLLNGGFTVLGTSPNDNGERQYFMFGAMGQGGRGAYALNVGGKNRETGAPVGIDAAQSSWTSTVPLFETEKGANNKLGLTIGTPKIGRVAVSADAADVRYAGFLASGYKDKPAENATVDSVNETALYVYDMLAQGADTGAAISGSKPGQLLKKIEVPGGIGGLSTPALLDIDLDGVYDLAYAGDYGGNMYRFDLRGGSNAWTVHRIFDGIGSQPIVAAPTISYLESGKYAIIFGTGSDIYTEDLLDTDTQAIYGIHDDVSNQRPAAATSADLLVQTLQERNGFYYLSNHPMQNTHRGWKIDLNDPKIMGERVVTQGYMILRTAILETRAYTQEKLVTTGQSADVCIADSQTVRVTPSSRQLQIDSKNGGALTAASARIRYLQNSDLPMNEAQYPSGRLLMGSLINSTYAATVMGGRAMTNDGQGGGSGEDDKKVDRGPKGPGDSSRPTERPNNTCFHSGDNQQSFFSLSNGDAGVNAIDGPMCGQNIRRISWRELI